MCENKHKKDPLLKIIIKICFEGLIAQLQNISTHITY